MDIGFTGTRKGMTLEQKRELVNISEGFGKFSLHHGGCIGADEEAHMNIPANKVYIYQGKFPKLSTRLAMTLELGWDSRIITILPPLPPIDRNHLIVDSSDLLIACPETKEEVVRSGTWATVRYARKEGKRVIIIYPDGEVEDSIA